MLSGVKFIDCKLDVCAFSGREVLQHRDSDFIYIISFYVQDTSCKTALCVAELLQENSPV